MKKLLRTLGLMLSLSVCATSYAEIAHFQAGELPAPEKIEKVLSAGNPSDVLLLAVAPEKLAGFAGFKMDSAAGKLFPAELQKLPTLGKIASKGSTLSAEKIIDLQPSLIVDVGNVTPNYQDQAQRTFEQTRVPYLLLDGKLSATPDVLRSLGKWLGKSEEAEKQAQYAEQTLLLAGEFAQKFAKTAYLARGANGLQTGQKGSIHTEAMELLGIKNVVEGDNKGLTQVSLEQLLIWNPDLILTQYPEFYQTVQTAPEWQALSAVKNQRVFLIPHKPFGWIDSPPSLNRLLGVRWLQHILSGKPAAAFAPEVQQFYKLFYHIDLTEAQAKQLLE